MMAIAWAERWPGDVAAMAWAIRVTWHGHMPAVGWPVSPFDGSSDTVMQRNISVQSIAVLTTILSPTRVRVLLECMAAAVHVGDASTACLVLRRSCSTLTSVPPLNGSKTCSGVRLTPRQHVSSQWLRTVMNETQDCVFFSLFYRRYAVRFAAHASTAGYRV